MTLTANEFLANVEHSHQANELEQAMAHVFIQMVADNELDKLNDLHDYGVPWAGGKTVVERFSKLHGLLVLRRDDGGLSDKLMKVILSEWVSLASEQGLGFLVFVLDMLYPKQSEIIRLWHSKHHAQYYPQHLTENETTDKFLTSRIRIKLTGGVDLSELSELAPTLRSLVPAHIVPDLAVYFEGDTADMGVAVVAERYHVADFTPREWG